MANNARDRIIIRLDSKQGYFIKKKLTIRTSPPIWRGTAQPIILPFSVHSAIYDGIDGDFKIASFLRVIKSKVKGKVIILICEGAHTHVLSLKYSSDVTAALLKCRKDAEVLLERFKNEMIGCTVVFWEDFVSSNLSYNKFKGEVMMLFEGDPLIHLIINEDAEKTYTAERAHEYPDKSAYINKAELDLIEMIISVKIMYENNLKILIYPGKVPRLFSYLQSYLFPEMLFINTGIKQGVAEIVLQDGFLSDSGTPILHTRHPQLK